ncbi:MAG: 23S rRNA (uracil(1939)-C(5))-methyltransferase RlmD, partial [Calditrichaceae bacterium]
MTEKKYPVGRGKDYEFKIEKLAFGGAGVARMDNYVVFVKGALPGDRVIARITKRKSSFAEARLISIIDKAPQRIEAPCPHFEWCGGCTWQNLSYKDQLDHKFKIVTESLHHIAGMKEIPVKPVLPSEKIFSYRNKMEFSFSDRKWLTPRQLEDKSVSKEFALGLHVPGTFDKILHISRCLLQSDTANDILSFVSDYTQKNGIEPYGIKTHKGFLRFLVLRESTYTGKLMVNIVTAYENTKTLKTLADELINRFPSIGSVVNNINSRLAQIAVGEKEILLAGEPVIQEKLGAFEFNISANSFFQTNTLQAENLYTKVMEFADLRPDQIVWDLYAGTGTISLFLAQKARQVIGFELVESAVKDAEKNALDHGIRNASFVGGDLLNELREVNPKPDVLVTDPPRSGMHEKVVEYINTLAPQRIVYVSCNPTTLSRDLA